MVPKNGTRLPKLPRPPSEAELAVLIGHALQEALGASRRAAKTVIGWTGVSDHTARAWLNGRTNPSALHLIMLAARCDPVMTVVLNLTGHGQVAISIDLEIVENRLAGLLHTVRELRGVPN